MKNLTKSIRENNWELFEDEINKATPKRIQEALAETGLFGRTDMMLSILEKDQPNPKHKASLYWHNTKVLHNACLMGHKDTIAKIFTLLPTPVSAHKDTYGRAMGTAASAAFKRDEIDALKQVFDFLDQYKSATPILKTESLLPQAVANGAEKCLAYLIEKGNKPSSSSLQAATRFGHAKCAVLLLSFCPKISERAAALRLAIEGGHLAAATVVFESIQSEPRVPWPSLMEAAIFSDNPQMIDLVIDKLPTDEIQNILNKKNIFFSNKKEKTRNYLKDLLTARLSKKELLSAVQPENAAPKPRPKM